MHIALIYPPNAYSNMPYLAPALLKGYLHEHSGHTAHTVDLNAEYRAYIRSEKYVGDFSSIPLGRAGELLRDLVSHQGQASFESLRDIRTYDQWDDVRVHSAVLSEVQTLVDRTDQVLLAEQSSSATGLTRQIDDHARLSHGYFIQEQVSGGLVDESDAVGITIAYMEQMLPSLVLARCIKQRSPHKPVIVGGGAVTHLLERLTKDAKFYDLIDYVVPYEGEYSLVEVLDHLDNSSSPPASNVVSRDNAGKVVYRRDLLSRPKVHPVPDFSDLRPDLYPTPSPIFPILTSKGCYWGKCAFCTHHEGYGQGYYRMTDETVQNAIKAATQADGDHFYFVDEAIPPRQFTMLAQEFLAYRNNGLSPVWMAEARLEPSMVKEQVVSVLEQSGCVLLVNGIESGCQAVVDRMHKGVDLELVSRFAELCSKSDSIRTGWMFFVGFPGESLEQAQQTFRYIEHNSEQIDYVSIGAFGLERGSPIWNDPARYGITKIHGQGDPSLVLFDYEMADGTSGGRAKNEELLRSLWAEHRGLRPLADSAVDRAFAMFRPARRAKSQKSDPSLNISWPSAAGTQTRYIPHKRRFEVVRDVSISQSVRAPA
ncbi:B12-binding domain-containing radical SAM protein [Streptomyces sp. NPDC088775]|uniref:B12-binding domain-containing radical SAM protein n=1 Tax=Streptomyces sp. NPDC088775 TaxID=3365896 RepID=UPI003816C114